MLVVLSNPSFSLFPTLSPLPPPPLPLKPFFYGPYEAMFLRAVYLYS